MTDSFVKLDWSFTIRRSVSVLIKLLQNILIYNINVESYCINLREYISSTTNNEEKTDLLAIILTNLFFPWKCSYIEKN